MSSVLEGGFLTTGPLGKSPVPSSFNSSHNLLLSFFFKIIILFIYYWLFWVCVAVWAFL